LLLEKMLYAKQRTDDEESSSQESNLYAQGKLLPWTEKADTEFDEGEKSASETGSVLALGPRPRRQPALGKHNEAIEGSRPI
jgi:hypothetical protein